MPTKEKSEATHIYIGRLIAKRTDTNRHKHMQHRNNKIIKHKIYIKQVQYK